MKKQVRKQVINLFLFFALCLLPFVPLSAQWTQQGADINGEADSDRSGTSVSLSSDGTTVAIGAPNNAGAGGSLRGHVRVYQYSNPLPVELLDFKGSPSVSGNLLTWTTANEINNKGFQVELQQSTGNRQQLGGTRFCQSTRQGCKL